TASGPGAGATAGGVMAESPPAEVEQAPIPSAAARARAETRPRALRFIGTFRADFALARRTRGNAEKIKPWRAADDDGPGTACPVRRTAPSPGRSGRR